MPQINILPPFQYEGESGSPDMSKNAVLHSAECSEMVKVSEMLAQFRKDVIEICHKKEEKALSVEKIMDAFDNAVQKMAEQVKTEKVSAFLQESCDEMREGILKQAVNQEVSLKLEERIDLLEKAMLLNADFLRQVPAEYKNVCADFIEGLENSGLPIFTKESLKKKSTREFASSVLKGVSDIAPEMLADVWENKKIAEIFSNEEVEVWKEKYKTGRAAVEAKNIFDALEADILINADLDKARKQFNVWLKDNTQNLSEDVVKTVNVLLSLYIRKEKGENVAAFQSDILKIFKGIKELYDAGKEDDALIFLLSSGLKQDVPEVFEEIYRAFENGSIGVSGKEDAFSDLMSDFCRTGVISENEAYQAFLSGHLNYEAFNMLKDMIEKSPALKGIFFLRRAMAEIIASQRSQEAVYADLSGLYADFVVFASEERPVSEIKRMLQSYTDL